MTTLTDQQQRVLLILDRIKEQVQKDQYNGEVYSDFLENMLNKMLGCDIFGTEGQCDPRGDMRDHDYSMWNVQGYDD